MGQLGTMKGEEVIVFSDVAIMSPTNFLGVVSFLCPCE